MKDSDFVAGNASHVVYFPTTAIDMERIEDNRTIRVIRNFHHFPCMLDLVDTLNEAEKFHGRFNAEFTSEFKQFAVILAT